MYFFVWKIMTTKLRSFISVGAQPAEDSNSDKLEGKQIILKDKDLLRDKVIF